MCRPALVVLALSACGRIGFDGGAPIDAGHTSGDATTTMDAPPLLGSVTCATMRIAITDPDPIDLVVEAAAEPMIAWRTSTGALSLAVLDAANNLTVGSPLFPSTNISRLGGAHPIVNGHALSIEYNNMAFLYAISPTLNTAGVRGMAEPGVGRSTLAGFGDYVVWGHVVAGSPRAMLFERLDANGFPTPHSNRTTGADVRELAVNGATSSHAHLVWGEADGTCVASEMFGGFPDLVDVHEMADCRSPRNASGAGDSIATIYATTSGALRFYGLSGDYEHDIELSPSARAPAVADDGTVVWAAWFDDRVGGALVLAKIELAATMATVTAKTLDGVTPTGPDAIALVGDANPPKLLVLEAGALAVVRPCL